MDKINYAFNGEAQINHFNGVFHKHCGRNVTGKFKNVIYFWGDCETPWSYDPVTTQADIRANI